METYGGWWVTSDLGRKPQVLPHAAAQVGAARFGILNKPLDVPDEGSVERSERGATL
jgi:hypothetical protein